MTITLHRACNPLLGIKVSLHPWSIPERKVSFGTDCKMFVARKGELQEFVRYETLEPGSREFQYALELIDAQLPPEETVSLSIGKLRRWSGPPAFVESCPACDRDERMRLDPCRFGSQVVNRNYLAIASAFLGDFATEGKVSVWIPKTGDKPILLDNEDWRIAIMPLSVDFADSNRALEIPVFPMGGGR